MREGWTYKKLGEVCKIQYGFAFDSSCFCEDNKYPQLIRIRDVVRGYSETYYNGEIPEGYYVNNGDYLIGMDGEFNIAPWKSEKALLNQRVCKISSSDDTILERYIYYQMQIVLKQIEDETPYVTVKHLSAKKLNSVEFPVPSLSEQQIIVSELDKINELISLKKAQLSDLDNLAQSIFYDMFGNLQDDTPLSHFINSLGGGKSLAGKVPCINKVLKTGAVTYDCFDGNAVKDLPIDYVPLPEHLLKDGDLLVSRMNTPELVGSCAYVWKAPDNTYLPDRLWRAVLKQGNNPIYLWFSIIQLKAKEQIRTLASGTSGSMKNISKPRFLSVKIKNAPLSLQQEFAKRIELIEQQKAQISSTIKDLETLLASRMQYWFD